MINFFYIIIKLTYCCLKLNMLKKTMYKLVFDIETTGIPARKGFDQYFPYTNLKKFDRSRIVSIAWCVYSKKGVLQTSRYYLVKPVNFKIDDKSKATEINGITSERADKEGILFTEIINNLQLDLENVNKIIAHNILFDSTILKSELVRIGNEELVDKLNSISEYCTMKSSTPILKLPCAKENMYKSPKLMELYNYYFPNQTFNSHDALEDVKACARCYFKLKSNLDITTLPKKVRCLGNDWDEWENEDGVKFYHNTVSKVKQWEVPE